MLFFLDESHDEDKGENEGGDAAPAGHPVVLHHHRQPHTHLLDVLKHPEKQRIAPLPWYFIE